MGTRVALIIWAFVALSPLPGRAGPFDSQPLPPETTLVREQDLTVPPQSSGSANIVVPSESILVFDYSIEAGKKLIFALLTKAQWEQVLGQKTMDGRPLGRFNAVGSGTASVEIPKGEYQMVLYNFSPNSVALSYRASYRRLEDKRSSLR